MNEKKNTYDHGQKARKKRVCPNLSKGATIDLYAGTRIQFSAHSPIEFPADGDQPMQESEDG